MNYTLGNMVISLDGPFTKPSSYSKWYSNDTNESCQLNEKVKQLEKQLSYEKEKFECFLSGKDTDFFKELKQKNQMLLEESKTLKEENEYLKDIIKKQKKEEHEMKEFKELKDKIVEFTNELNKKI